MADYYVIRDVELPDTWLKRHHDDEVIDRVTIDIVPRYKTSEMSGDEWRISAVLRFWRKGQQMYERSFTKLEYAMNFLPMLRVTEFENGKIEQPDDQWLCFQPGCSEPATVEYRLKAEYCNEGDAHEPAFKSTLRRFCDKHSTRGDCGLEDSDTNYELVGRITQRAATAAGERR